MYVYHRLKLSYATEFIYCEQLLSLNLQMHCIAYIPIEHLEFQSFTHGGKLKEEGKRWNLQQLVSHKNDLPFLSFF